MKLLYSIGSITQTGGTEKVFANKANYFADKLGYEVHLLVNENNGSPAYHYSDKIVIHNMHVTQYLDKTVIPYWSYNRLIRKLYKPYTEKIEEIKPDIIIVLQHSTDDFIIPILPLDIPTVREFHFSKKAVFEMIKEMPYSLKKWRTFAQTKRLFRFIEKYDYVVLLTEADNQFSKYPNKSIVIPNVLELEEITPRDFAENYRRVISVGSMHNDRKGFANQINIWKSINRIYPAWKLDIYGDGILRKDLQKLIDDNNLTHIVTLKGITHDIMAEFRKSSFFIFTSKAEGFPMVLLEAMSCGLPCVAYDCPEGPADIIQNNKNGFLIQTNDESTMIEKISSLIANPEEIKRLGKAAQSSAKSYLPSAIIPKWVDFFNQIKKK